MSLLNTEMVFSLLQGAEMQVRVYQKFLELLNGDKEEAKVHTEIYMKSIFQPQPRKEK